MQEIVCLLHAKHIWKLSSYIVWSLFCVTYIVSVGLLKRNYLFYEFLNKLALTKEILTCMHSRLLFIHFLECVWQKVGKYWHISWSVNLVIVESFRDLFGFLVKCFFSKPPENIRKRELFWQFQGAWKSNIELKSVNSV